MPRTRPPTERWRVEINELAAAERKRRRRPCAPPGLLGRLRFPSTHRAEATLPIPVRRALRKLGADIRDARRRRRIPTTTMAERALISRVTLTKVERGDSGVGLGIYATVLFVLGMTERLAELADPRHDAVGLRLEDELLPQRISGPRKPRGNG